MVVSMTFGRVAVKWLLLGWVNVCRQVNHDDDDDESLKLVFAHSYSLETVTSVLMKICSGK